MHKNILEQINISAVSLQAVGPVEGHDSTVWGGWQIHPGAVHCHQVTLQTGLVPGPHMEHPLPIDLSQTHRDKAHTPVTHMNTLFPNGISREKWLHIIETESSGQLSSVDPP